MKRLYVISRRDLGPSYAAVQAGHALAEYMLHGWGNWQNEVLVYLGVENENSLYYEMGRAREKGLECHEFYEPDLNNQLTAIAVYGDDTKDHFNNLKLL